LVYYRGEYHLFYQYNPKGNQWGNMSWGHAVTRDLVHWRELPVAIPQTFNADGESIEDIFSGSAVVDSNNTSGFGTRKNPPLVAVYTSAYTSNHPTLAGRQAQSLAYSTDGGRTFTKYAGNPVLDIGSGEFRDPKVFWYAPAKEWRMVVVKAVERKVAIYRSPNLKQWTHLSDFGPAGAVGGVWECPDLFPLAVDGNPRNVKWVMVVNLNPGSIAGGSGGQYFVGDFDGTTFTSDNPATYTPPAGTVLQDFEAPTFGPWTSTGTAFGTGPAAGAIDGQQAVTGYEGQQLANSFHNGDGTVGTLTSPDFTVNQAYLNFLIGGGNHPNVPGTQLSTEPPEGTLLFDGFELPDDTNLAEAGWTLTGDFVPDRNPSTSGGEGAIGRKRLNTWEGGPRGDDNQGTLSSPAFEITDNYLNFLLGGGGRSDGSLQAELVVAGQVVRTATGANDGILNWKNWDVSAYRGQDAVLRIKDQATGGWGHLTFDHPVLSPTGALPRSVETTVNLVVDDQIVRTATGSNSESLDWVAWDLRDLQGERARIQVNDNNTGGWGHVLADQFTLANAPAESSAQRAHWLDYGRDFYAGVTFNHAPNNRRIMIAWMNNWQYANQIPTDPWRSAMAAPRELTLQKIGGRTELIGTPVKELQSLRQGRPFQARNQRLLEGTTTLRGPGARGDTVEIRAEFRARDADKFGVHVRAGNGQRTVIGYDVDRAAVYVDRTRSGDVGFNDAFPSIEYAPLQVRNGKVTLRILVDRSSVEVFADNGHRTITDQVFPDRNSQAIRVFSNGGRAELQKITVWQLDSIWKK
ncbi:MAG TPA: GH32 C-terminal domain-containing protein, partial [Microlunatus sp.]|nr:GH32 C-terminal domain-containing protein [Microlunatus sp.]